jgi:hypothetical protein
LVLKECARFGVGRVEEGEGVVAGGLTKLSRLKLLLMLSRKASKEIWALRLVLRRRRVLGLSLPAAGEELEEGEMWGRLGLRAGTMLGLKLARRLGLVTAELPLEPSRLGLELLEEFSLTMKIRKKSP